VRGRPNRAFFAGPATIHQIAALPYRAQSGAVDAAVSVLLVTSRQTRRWVLPKGNPVAGLSLHESAAHEALEEAGVRGAACPTPIGRYRYRKRRRTGASVMVDVDVFPIAVTDELAEWEEDDERERRWFPLKDAADAVEEADLKQIICSFRAEDVATGSFPLTPAAIGQKTRQGMFHWFQTLMPKQGNFFELFEAHAATLCAGGNALVRLLQGGEGMADHIREIEEREHDADNIIREVLQGVRRTFLTPFDRSAIISLISAMDDAIDQMQQTAGAISLYDVTEFTPEMRDMAAIIVDCARVTAEALPLLRNIRPNAGRLHQLTERLVTMEGQADGIHARGLKNLFHAKGEAHALSFVVNREIYSHLERVIDRFEDVANEIDGLVIDHA
jgi:predicted phosphate transport protein (TIGR00153 family)